MIIQINDQDSFEQLIAGDKPVLADFYADWCGPCKMLAPMIQEIDNEQQDKFSICKINVDHNPELAQKFLVQSIPTLISFKNSMQHRKIIGLSSKQDILDMLE